MNVNQHASEQPTDHRKIENKIKIYIEKNENKNTTT